jgi:hypothetical protein
MHDVRLLCRRPVCGRLIDERAMVRVGPMKALAHDRCVFKQLGEDMMNLPKEEWAKFSASVVGLDIANCITLPTYPTCAARSRGRPP